MTSPMQRSDSQPLRRLIHPQSVAFVGVGEQSALASNILQSLESDREVHFVHPKYDRVFGRPSVPTIAELGKPIDCVFVATSAAQTVAIAEQAVDLDVGGLVSVAAGFGEVGGGGVDLQRRLAAAAASGGFPVVGPNGVGLINVREGVDLSLLAPFKRRPGSLSVVSHSGGVIEAIGTAAWRPGGIGLNILVSAGNEAVTDMADFVDHLVDDDATEVIALAIESIRRPAEFFAAVARASEANKPVVAIKLGRTERSRRMAQSHTGSLIDDAWTYEVALKQAGVQVARDAEDLVDCVQLFDRLPRRRWSRAEGVAVLTATGGYAQIVADSAHDRGIVLPELAELESFVAEKVPGGAVANPLDVTGVALMQPGLWEEVVSTYEAAEGVDTILYPSQHADWDTDNRWLADDIAKVAATSSKPFIIASLAGNPGGWLTEYDDAGIAVAAGVEGALRAIDTMGRFVRSRRDMRVRPEHGIPALPFPDGKCLTVPEGRMLDFASTMRLLENQGIQIAPYHVVPPDAPVGPPFEGPYVVKLADLAHRTEHDAVRLGVHRDELAATVEELRELARQEGLPVTVVIQQLIFGHAETFIGVHNGADIGPVVAFGLGGVLLEAIGRIGGRIAPFEHADAEELLAEFDDLKIMNGFRGGPAWDRAELVDLLLSVSRMAAGGRAWIETIDLNPVVVTPEGPVVVDGLVLLREQPGVTNVSD